MISQPNRLDGTGLNPGLFEFILTPPQSIIDPQLNPKDKG